MPGVVRSGRPIDRTGPRPKPKPIPNPTGRPPLGGHGRGDPTVRLCIRVPASLKRKLDIRRRELGLSRSKYLRRIIENATLAVASDEGVNDGDGVG